jgi:hypothetical protein
MLLADERGTARRQELLKALWKLSQQGEEAESSLTPAKETAGSAPKHQAPATIVKSESHLISS